MGLRQWLWGNGFACWMQKPRMFTCTPFSCLLGVTQVVQACRVPCSGKLLCTLHSMTANDFCCVEMLLSVSDCICMCNVGLALPA